MFLYGDVSVDMPFRYLKVLLSKYRNRPVPIPSIGTVVLNCFDYHAFNIPCGILAIGIHCTTEKFPEHLVWLGWSKEKVCTIIFCYDFLCG